MPKFELIIEQLVNHQTTVVVEADDEDTLTDALDEVEARFRRSGIDASDYVHELYEIDSIKIIEVNEDYSEEIKEVECSDYIFINDKEEEI